MAETKQCDVVIIGAGPAGLTAAYHLSRNGKNVILLEANPSYVGGISRTENQDGFRFDIGGHRFFSKSADVVALWKEFLPVPGDLLVQKRRSRIYYRGRFFSYPLKPVEAFFGLGILESVHCLISYLWARLRPVREPSNFEEWVSNHFGSRLYEIFFKTYTEKVWGMPCHEISADWAAQRIKGLSLGKAVWAALFQSGARSGPKTLIGEFYYPRKGPGMLWESCAEKICGYGGAIRMGERVFNLAQLPEGQWEVTTSDSGGGQNHYLARHVISSAPIRELAAMVSPAFSAVASNAASHLAYRDFITVAIMLREGSARFDDQWIYIHDPEVLVGRIQNYRAWSTEMIPDEGSDCLGMEYFCFAGQAKGLWNYSDEELAELAISELVKLGLAVREEVTGHRVIRQEKAYPVYDENYSKNVDTIRGEMENRYPDLWLVGRNGMHKYNNQDHSMMTALLCAENILQNQIIYDLWRINEDAEYGESGDPDHSVSGLRSVPERTKTQI